MEFSFEKSLEILERTPHILYVYLNELSDDWLYNNEGEDTWSPYDVVGHLIVGEKLDWIVRAKIILSTSENKTFEPFDRFAQFQEEPKPINKLLTEFKTLRHKNIATLKSFNISDAELKQTAIHPELGEVTLKQLISTWAVHDLGHIAQISRVMAKQYQSETGPWVAYLGILN